MKYLLRKYSTGKNINILSFILGLLSMIFLFCSKNISSINTEEIINYNEMKIILFLYIIILIAVIILFIISTYYSLSVDSTKMKSKITLVFSFIVLLLFIWCYNIVSYLYALAFGNYEMLMSLIQYIQTINISTMIIKFAMILNLGNSIYILYYMFKEIDDDGFTKKDREKINKYITKLNTGLSNVKNKLQNLKK